MPDFLHEGREMEPPKEGAPSEPPKEEASSAPAKHTTFRTRRPGSRKAEKEEDEKKRKKKQPSKLFTEYYGIIFLLLIAAFIGAGYFILNPLYADFKTVNGDIETQLQTLEDEHAFLESLERSISAAESIPEETLMRVDEALPRDIEIPKLLLTMSRIADENGASLTSIQFTPAEEPRETEMRRRRKKIELEPLGISLTLASPGYQATRSFLEDMEKNIRVLDVRSINVTGNEQTGELSYTIELTAYSIKKPEQSVISSDLTESEGLQDEMYSEEVMP